MWWLGAEVTFNDDYVNPYAWIQLACDHVAVICILLTSSYNLATGVVVTDNRNPLIDRWYNLCRSMSSGPTFFLVYNSGLLLVFLLDIIPWEDIFTYWGCQTAHCVGSVEQRVKPRPIFCVSVKLWLHSDMCIWARFTLSQRILRV
jgi:hypothetical protein